jgi:hypothetical protein
VPSINSFWCDCVPGIASFYDPPFTLTRGTGFTMEAPLNPVPATGSLSMAFPGATPVPVTAPVIRTSNTELGATSTIIPPSRSRASTPSSQSAKETILVSPLSDIQTQVIQSLSSDRPVVVDTPLSSNPHLSIDPAATVITPPDDKSSSNDENSQYNPVPSDLVPTENKPKYVIGSQTVNAGTIATIPGLEVSLPLGGSSIVIEGKTIPIDTFAHSLNMGASIVSSGKTHSVNGAAEGTSLVVGSRTLPMSSLLGQITSFPNVIIGTKEMPLKSFLAGISGDPKLVMAGTTMPLSELHDAVTGGANVVIGTWTVAFSDFLQDMEPVSWNSCVVTQSDRTESSETFAGTTASFELGGMI